MAGKYYDAIDIHPGIKKEKKKKKKRNKNSKRNI